MIGPAINEHIVALGRAEAVIIHFLIERDFLELLPGLRLIVTAVEKALAVGGPRGAAVFDPLHFIGQNVAADDI